MTIFNKKRIDITNWHFNQIYTNADCPTTCFQRAELNNLINSLCHNPFVCELFCSNIQCEDDRILHNSQ